MKLIPALMFGLCLLPGLSKAQEAKFNPQDRLTTAGQAAWTAENLGPQVTRSTVMSCCVDPGDGTSSATAYFSLMGDPGLLVVVDFDSGEVQRVLKMPGANGSYYMHRASDGNIYIATHTRGLLMRYRPGADEVETLGSVAGHVSFVWDLIEPVPGKIVGGCYNEAIVFEYDIATAEFRNLGSAKENEDYVRSIAWSETNQRAYAGIGSHADVVEINLETGEKRSILPEPYRKSEFAYTVGTAGSQVLVRLSPGDSLVVNPQTTDLITTIPAIGSNQISDQGPNGKVYYTSKGSLIEYDPSTNAATTLDVKIKGDTRGMNWTTSADGKTSELLVATTGGNTVRYNPQTGKSQTVHVDLPKIPLQLQSIIVGPDDKLYSSGYVAGQLGVFDSETREHKQYGDVRQAEGMTFYNETLYLGTYPGANLSRFDTTQSAPKVQTFFSLAEDGQDRPFAMQAVPEAGAVYMGTVPNYGALGGALAVFHPDSLADNDREASATVYRNLIENHGIVSFAYRDGVLYGGTTIHGGLGIRPVEENSRLFAWDVKENKLLYSLEPVKDRAAITSLQFDDSGMLWGWALGTVFVFDPKTREVIHTEDRFPFTTRARHVWRAAFMTPEHNGKIYGSISSNVFEIDVKTRQITVLAKGPFSSVNIDSKGRLYMISRTDVVRFNPKQTAE